MNTPEKYSAPVARPEEKRFVPMLFGHDINVYSMARAFHEAYGVCSYVFGKAEGGPCRNSRIIAGLTCRPDMDKPEVFLEHVQRFAGEHKEKKVFLLGCGDNYAKLASQHRGQYPENVIAPYVDIQLMERLTHKESFYQVCAQNGINYPQTVVFRRGELAELTAPFDPPYILKPSNCVAYWEHPFPNQDKVFTLSTWEELRDTAGRVFESGYDDSLILQEFIPGDDTHMRVMTCYSDQTGRVRMMAMGQVLLEEHTPHGIGNHAVILGDRNPYLMEVLRNLLEKLGVVGFSNFDIKYDERNGLYRLFEVNLRQGRSNYYVTLAGSNMARWLVGDYIENNLPIGLTKVTKHYLWRVVPRTVLYRYTRRMHHAELRMLIGSGNSANPLFYPQDLSLPRLARLIAGLMRQSRNYRRYAKRPNWDHIPNHI